MFVEPLEVVNNHKIRSVGLANENGTRIQVNILTNLFPSVELLIIICVNSLQGDRLAAFSLNST